MYLESDSHACQRAPVGLLVGDSILKLPSVRSGQKRRFLEGDDGPDLPAALQRCWERVRREVEPSRLCMPVLTEQEVSARADSVARWTRELPHVFERIFAELPRDDHVVLFADADAAVLARDAGGSVASASDEAGILLGSVWREEIKGTNAIGTALVEGRPVCVHGNAHFADTYGEFTCYAVPIFDLSGELLGVLDATTTRDRRRDLGAQVMLAAALGWERRVRAGVGPTDHVLPWRQVQRLLARYGGAAAVFGPRGTLRHAVGASANRPGFADIWESVRTAALEGRDTIDGDDERWHVEPFFDPRGRLCEVFVFHERLLHAAPRRAARGAEALDALAGTDSRQRAACALAGRVAATDLPVALLSETGTGKELLARAIHQASAVRDGPFVAVNCAGLPQSLIESELFGYAPGAFTGASSRGREGWLASADGGTLFLDEVGDLRLPIQSALLRFLEDGSYCRIGERTIRTATVRLLTATSRDLQSMVTAGLVRPDFFYRICAVPITLPPLRDRTDRVELAELLLDELAAGRTIRLSEEAKDHIRNRRWPGNVRQLKFALQAALALCDDDLVLAEHIPAMDCGGPPLDAAAPGAAPAAIDALNEPPRGTLAGVGRSIEHVTAVLKSTGGNVAEAARRLGVARSTIYRQLRRHGAGNVTES